jgi:hypothetical protein
MMNSAKQYHAYARECLNLAEEAEQPDVRKSLIELKAVRGLLAGGIDSSAAMYLDSGISCQIINGPEAAGSREPSRPAARRQAPHGGRPKPEALSASILATSMLGLRPL